MTVIFLVGEFSAYVTAPPARVRASRDDEGSQLKDALYKSIKLCALHLVVFCIALLFISRLKSMQVTWSGFCIR